MASKLIKNRDEIYKLLLLGWRKLPSSVGMSGKFKLLLNAIDTDRVPKQDPGDRPWGRFGLNIGNGRPTSISGRRYRVEGSFRIEMLVRAAKTNSSDIADQCAKFLAEWFSGYRGDIVFTSISTYPKGKQQGYSKVDLLARFRWDEVRSKGESYTGDTSNDEGSGTSSFIFTDGLIVITDENDEPLGV